MSVEDGKSPLVTAELPRIDILVIIISAPKNHIERNTVRNTWLKQAGRNTRHLFVVGVDGLKTDDTDRVYDEQRMYGDLLTLPIVDSYRNLSLKVATCIQAVRFLYTYKYLLKVDEDTFVHLNRLENEVRRLGTADIYWGYFSPSAHVFSSGRWKESSWFLCERYLSYAVGGGYLIGYKLARYIADNHHLFKLYSSEDVTIGVWLASLSTNRIHDIRFDTQVKSRGCWNDQLVKHKVTPGDMLDYSDRIDRGLNLCKQQVATDLKPYSYDWSRKPSKCCIVVDPSNTAVPRIYSSRDQDK